jgi:hypothetical protein
MRDGLPAVAAAFIEQNCTAGENRRTTPEEGGIEFWGRRIATGTCVFAAATAVPPPVAPSARAPSISATADVAVVSACSAD